MLKGMTEHKDKEHGKTFKHEVPCSINHVATQNKKNTALEVSKKSLQSLILCTFFMILYMYIAPGQGQTTPWGQNFDVNRKASSLWLFVSSFKKISSTSDFMHIFYDFIHVYSPRARTDNPLGTKF